MSTTRRALVAYSKWSTFVQTTLDYLNALKQFSGHSVEYVHATHNALVDFDFGYYDIVFHSYCARFCCDAYVSDTYRQKLKAFRGIKVLAVQDEYDRTDTLKAAIKDIGFDIVLTCVPQDSLEYVYPCEEFPGVEFLTVFTGYAPDDFAASMPKPKPLAERSIPVGYRGRDIGGVYGRLGFEKFEIGRRMKEVCDARGIKCNIAMDEASRIYGTAWFDFVGDCQAMLGSESGCNVFDFDGSIAKRFHEMAAANGGIAPSYEQFKPFVAAREAEIEMGQISPRIFECAIMRTPMVLFNGRYSDAIKPDEHYLSLEKDFSNVDQILERLKDIPALEAMTQRAFDHLVASGSFTYRAFCTRIAAAIESKEVEKQIEPAQAARVPIGVRFDASGLMYERPTAMPKAAKDFRVPVAENSYYDSEIQRLSDEFDRLEAFFRAELLRIDARYPLETETLLSVTAASNIRVEIPSWDIAGSEFARVVDRNRIEIGEDQARRQQALAVFEASLSNDDEEAVIAAASHAMLAGKQATYDSLENRIRELNETYEADRSKIEREQRAIRRAILSVAMKVPLKHKTVLGLILIKFAFRVVRSRARRVLAGASVARQMITLFPRPRT
ncbi:hypothetical protein FG93_05407 [Bosea sp. LC85]|uniref:hypothetical protein n=1 Tax=Bosea sp. LC85 TaxID=1502851 RepID=UPI0004E2BC52|nr:hypothetical protein [Bosea sp. LC85]KFC63898.1 hypothetical protein FG93_05407 [Bosea sp. LC85]